MVHWEIKSLLYRLLIFICVGAICVSCSLFIADEGSPLPETANPDEPPESPMPCDPVSAKSIASLQFEETVSSEKIHLVDLFAGLSDENLQACFQAATNKELIGLTILDLSRHTDSSLAEKAQALVEKFNITSYVEEEIKSEDEERQQNIVKFLLRIESDQVEKILVEVSFETDEKKNLITERVSNGTPQILIPTASEKGDRYYVQASWDPANEEQVSCLTNLFNEELATRRTLEEEEQKMKELNGKRWVYWYLKDWVLSIADSIRKCGSEASFVSGAAFVSSEPTLKSQSDCCQSTTSTAPDSYSVDEVPPEDPGMETKSDDGDALQKWDSNGNGKISCREARKHGIAPVRTGHPAYPFMKDRNEDGIVCEESDSEKS